MKKIIFTLSVFVFSFAGNMVKAQDLSCLEGSNYYLIALDSESEDIIYENGGNIVQDLRPNWNYTDNPDGEKALYIWSETYTSNDATGKGSLGQIGGYYDFSAAGTWSGLGWCMRKESPTYFPVDFTKIQQNPGNYRFHMAVQSPNAKPHGIQVFGYSEGEDYSLSAKFSVGLGVFEAGRTNLTPDFAVNKWCVIDIPVQNLMNLGWAAPATFNGNYFVVLSGAATNRIMFDAVFFYDTTAPSGIAQTKAENQLKVLVTKNIVEVLNATAPIEVYDLAGIKVKASDSPIFGVEELNKGAYIIKSGNAVAKAIIK